MEGGDHNAFIQLSVCTYYFTFFFSFPQTHISICQQRPHTCPLEELWSILWSLSRSSTPWPHPSQPTFISTHLLQPSCIPAGPTPSPGSFQPTHLVHVHPWRWVLVRLCSSSHPPFLTIPPTALCSKHMIAVTPLCEEAIPICQRPRKLRNVW